MPNQAIRTFVIVLTLAGCAGIAAVGSTAIAEDIPGSADHPLIGRFAGAEITAYEQRQFDEYQFPVATFAGDDSWLKPVEGVTTRVAYRVPGQHSLAEVARNYELALAGKGFEVVFECETDACGGGDFSYGVEVFPIPKMILDRFNFRYLGARLARPEGEIYATVLSSADTDKQVRVQVTVVETAALQQQMVDAAQIANAFAERGSIALYGIYFDTDKAEIKPDSAPTLAEMAKFLSGSPELEVVIVGHTDNLGSLDYNLDLSHRRALAVAEALSTDHNIDAGRMTAAGAGFLAPVARNDSEAGRAKNRRVEMIPR